MPRLALRAGFGLFLAASISAKEIADYRVGDTITDDIVTPVPLMVVDPEATEALKLKEAQRFPVMVRFDLATADKVETDLRDAFAYNRSNFLSAVEASFNRRQLDAAAVALPEFRRVIASFEKQQPAFPLSANLAESWAGGDSESPVLASLIEQMRAVMARPIRPDAWPENLRLGYHVRLVSVSNGAEAVTLEIADARGVTTPHASLLTLSRARAVLPEGLLAEELALARFAAIWLRPNCHIDVELTRQDRARHTDALYAADKFEAGQIIARAGQVVDGRILEALKQLGEKTAAGHLQHQVIAEQARASQIRLRNRWLVAGLASVTLLSVIAIWWLAQRKRIVSMLPAKIASDAAGAVISCPSCEQQQRTVAAEQTIEAARPAVHAGVLNRLARLFRERLVRGLISQRGQLIEVQQSAADEMAEMERRLNELRTPLQERLRAYEKRIRELEKALAAKGEENRELIIAKILLTRQQLEAERARNLVVLN